MMTKTGMSLHLLNEYFDHIYVLTLIRSQKRQCAIRKLLSDVQWSFFEGVDKKELEAEKVLSAGVYNDALHRKTKRTHRGMNLGEIACALSHRQMYKDILDKGYQRVLILEDDALTSLSSLRQFEQSMAELPLDWDVLMLGYYGEKPPGWRYALQKRMYLFYRACHLFNWHKVSKAWIHNLQMKEYSPHWYEIGKVLGTHAYAITNRAAKNFIRYQTPVHLQADRVFNYYKAEHGLKAFALKAPCFTLSELSRQSDIQ